MSFFFTATFWGIVIILFGLSIILKEVFHISFPIMRVLFGVLLIYFGVKVIYRGFGNPGKESGSTTVFSNSHIRYNPHEKDYNIIFSNGTLDLSTMQPPAENKKMEVNVVFGNGHVRLNDSIPTMIELNAAFGSAESPDKEVSAFGKSIYTTANFNEQKPHLFIKASVVFGKLVIENKHW